MRIRRSYCKSWFAHILFNFFVPAAVSRFGFRSLTPLQREVRPADGEAAELRRENNRLQAELLEMTEKRLVDQSELAGVRAAMEDARLRQDEMSQTFQSMVDQCFRLEEVNFDVSKRLEKAETELDSFKETLAATSEAELQRQLNVREKENQDLKARLVALESEIAAVRQNSNRVMESVAAEMRLREQMQQAQVLQLQQQQAVQQQQQAAAAAAAQQAQQAQQQAQTPAQAAAATQQQLAQAQAAAQAQQTQQAQQAQQQYMAQMQAAQLAQHGQLPLAYAAMYGGLPRGYAGGIPMTQADLMKMTMHPAMMQQYAAAAAAAAAHAPVPGQTS